MENAYFREQDHGDTATFPLTDFCAQFKKQHLDVSPLNVRTRRAGENQLKGALVLPASWVDGTTIGYYLVRAACALTMK